MNHLKKLEARIKKQNTGEKSGNFNNKRAIKIYINNSQLLSNSAKRLCQGKKKNKLFSVDTRMLVLNLSDRGSVNSFFYKRAQ
jgi:hypothetical protein